MDFDREVARHKDAVYRQMLRVCGNVEDAEDVLVEALLRGFKRAESLDDPEAFRAWLTTIGKRVCYRLKEQRRPALSLEALQEAGVPMPVSGDLTPEEELDLRETHECVLRAFEALPENYKEVYRLREIEGLSAEETGRRLELTVANVKSRLHRARALVRRALDAAIHD